jgi:hypothetical protein
MYLAATEKDSRLSKQVKLSLAFVRHYLLAAVKSVRADMMATMGFARSAVNG